VGTPLGILGRCLDALVHRALLITCPPFASDSASLAANVHSSDAQHSSRDLEKHVMPTLFLSSTPCFFIVIRSRAQNNNNNHKGPR